MLRRLVHGKRRRNSCCWHLNDELLHIDDDRGGRVRLDRIPDCLDIGKIEHCRHETILRAVIPEDVGEARGDNRFKSGLLNRPHCVFAARSDTKRGPGNENVCAGVTLVV